MLVQSKMVQKPRLFWMFTLMCCFLGYTISQSQNAIGAHRIFGKTSFTCDGRPAGYYADIETGCQVYHMCDGLGRQFSYSCPNTTLFQQRMLICDHWYMVNCSKAESDYAANLLIGQRDKPFVPDDENHLRTPRPDLLDRPYAPDYSGESYRNEYKNEIVDAENEFSKKAVATKWSISQPSTLFLAPAPSSSLNIASKKNFDTVSSKSAPSIQSSYEKLASDKKTSSNLHPPSTAPKLQTDDSKHFLVTGSELDIYLNDIAKLEEEDLGTSSSLHYNTSADILADQTEKQLERKNSIPNSNKESKEKIISPPAREYEPPFLHPIYNKNYEEQLKEVDNISPTIGANNFLQSTTSTERSFTKSVLINQEEPNHPKTKLKTSVSNDLKAHMSTESHLSATQTHPTQRLTKSPKPNNGLINNDLLHYNILKSKNFEQKPSPFVVHNPEPQISLSLLPPFKEFTLHDTATTQGPPIYYEWKIPLNALQPPKLDPPIGVDGRKEDNETSANYNPSAAKQNFYTNDRLQAQKSNNSSVSHLIKDTPTTTSSLRLRKATNKAKQTNITTDNEIQQLRKDLLIPEFLFPLESVGRTGYEHNNTLNSFQLKIPDKKIENKNKSWYGENPQCPECHPSFVKPGSCEPCIKL